MSQVAALLRTWTCCTCVGGTPFLSTGSKAHLHGLLQRCTPYIVARHNGDTDIQSFPQELLGTVRPLTHAEQQLARGQVQHLQHSAAVLLVLLQQGGVVQVEDPDPALAKATGQLMAVWVISTALNHLSWRC